MFLEKDNKVKSIVSFSNNVFYSVFSFSNQFFNSRHSPLQKLNSLPNNTIPEMNKLKAFADDKINVAQMMISVSDRVESILGKGENADYQHFFLFP